MTLSAYVPTPVSKFKLSAEVRYNIVLTHVFADLVFADLVQIAEDPRLRPGAVAASIITVCNLIHATWPDTHILLAGVLVGGVRGDWGEGRSHKLPNRYFHGS